MPPLASFEPLAGASPHERFCILHPAAGPRRGAVLHVHAFADELNKTRRMVAQQAKRLAQDGFDVLLVDLLGCGDSPGEFGDATWERWVGDVADAAAWLRARAPVPGGPLWLWGTRLGALLAGAALPAARPDGLLLWQPVLDGAQHLQQFLRVADAQLGAKASHGRPNSAELLQALERGEAVEVAGYRVGAPLARALQRARLDPAVLPVARCVWLELETPAGHRALRSAAGPQVQALLAPGAPFWMQVDAEDSPAWWDATCAALR